MFVVYKLYICNIGMQCGPKKRNKQNGYILCTCNIGKIIESNITSTVSWEKKVGSIPGSSETTGCLYNSIQQVKLWEDSIPPTKICKLVQTTVIYVPWSKVAILGMVIQPLIGNPGILIMGPYKPLRNWVDEWPSPIIWKSWECNPRVHEKTIENLLSFESQGSLDLGYGSKKSVMDLCLLISCW